MANNLKEHVTEVADAIRAKKGTSAKINPQDFAKEILDLPSGGVVIPMEDIMTLTHRERLNLYTDGYDCTVSRLRMTARDDGNIAIYGTSTGGHYTSIGFNTGEEVAMIAIASRCDGLSMLIVRTSDYLGDYYTASCADAQLEWDGYSSGDIDVAMMQWYFNE